MGFRSLAKSSAPITSSVSSRTAVGSPRSRSTGTDQGYDEFHELWNEEGGSDAADAEQHMDAARQRAATDDARTKRDIEMPRRNHRRQGADQPGDQPQYDEGDDDAGDDGNSGNNGNNGNNGNSGNHGGWGRWW
mgnify:CR=1 FL=1